MKLCHLCTDVCQKTRKASTSDASDAQQPTCITIRSITDLLMIDGLICLDFVDVSSVIRDGGRAVVGIGEATGEGRATRAAEARKGYPLTGISPSPITSRYPTPKTQEEPQ